MPKYYYHAKFGAFTPECTIFSPWLNRSPYQRENRRWVSCAHFLVRVVLHITSLKDALFGFRTTQTKMADDEGGKDTLRQFVENECKAQALRVSWFWNLLGLKYCFCEMHFYGFFYYICLKVYSSPSFLATRYKLWWHSLRCGENEQILPACSKWEWKVRSKPQKGYSGFQVTGWSNGGRNETQKNLEDLQQNPNKPLDQK